MSSVVFLDLCIGDDRPVEEGRHNVETTSSWLVLGTMDNASGLSLSATDPYSYVVNNPVNAVDPTGFAAEPVDAGEGADEDAAEGNAGGDFAGTIQVEPPSGAGPEVLMDGFSVGAMDEGGLSPTMLTVGLFNGAKRGHRPKARSLASADKSADGSSTFTVYIGVEGTLPEDRARDVEAGGTRLQQELQEQFGTGVQVRIVYQEAKAMQRKAMNGELEFGRAAKALYVLSSSRPKDYSDAFAAHGILLIQRPLSQWRAVLRGRYTMGCSHTWRHGGCGSFPKRGFRRRGW
jgi:hypothetical protein